jgi:hypothetical protein
LAKSITETGFWDNILARKRDSRIEIAYGHHRLQAMKQVFKPEEMVNIPVRILDDAMMIKIMANENDEQWGTNAGIIDETVRVTKEFLEKHPGIIRSLVPTGATTNKFLLSSHGSTLIKTKKPKPFFLEVRAFGQTPFLSTKR